MSALTPDVAKAVGDLCVRCGLCCSGALFDHGRIQSDEIGQMAEKRFTIRSMPESDGTMRDAFAMPCPQLSGTTCSIYQLGRPAVCSSFFCKLANALTDGSKSEAEAHALVTEAHSKFTALRPYLQPDETWPAARARWRAIEAAPPGAPSEAHFRVMMAALQLWLNRHFRKTMGDTQPMF